MTSPRASLGYLLACVSMLAACDLSAPSARVRVLHLSPDAPAIDAYSNSTTRIANNLAFTESTELLDLPTGRRSFAATVAGSSVASAVASIYNADIEQSHDYTVFAFGEASALQLNILKNDKQGLASGSVRLRVVHAAVGVGAVDVVELPAIGAARGIAADIRFGAIAAPVDLPADPFIVGLDVDKDGNADLSFDVPALPSGTVVNVFALTDTDGSVFLLAQLNGANTARLSPRRADLRVLHLSPDAPAVEAFIDEARPAGFSPITFTQSTPYTSLLASTHRLDVTADGTVAGAVLRVPALALSPGRKYTAVAIGRLAAISAIAFESDDKDLAAASVRVRAIHAAPDVGEVDLYSVSADGTATAIVSDVSFGDVSAPLDLPADAYTIGVDINDDANPDLYFVLPALTAGTVANVFVTQDATGAVFALVQLDGATTLRVDVATSRIRVLHMSRTAPAVDAYANGVRVVEALPFTQSSPLATVQSGTFVFGVTAAAAPLSSAVLTVVNQRLLPDRDYTFVAYGDLAQIQGALYLDDTTGLNATTDIRLRPIHVAPLVVRGDIFDVRPSGNIRLVADIGFGEAKATPDLASTAYTLGFDAEANGTIDLSFDLPVLAPGNFANVFVANDIDDSVFVLVQTTNAGTLRVNSN